jgi:AcrR family transcriptional regulator
MPEISSPESGYLDAARDCIVAVGWRRTTLTDIARRAGVSRMTIYRRWPDTQTLLGDLLVREWSDLLLESGLAGGTEPTTRDQLARGITSMVAALRENELFLRIIEVDPELLHPYLFNRLGRNQTWILELTEHYIKDGQADGSIRAGDPALLAHTLLLTTYGFVLSAHTINLSMSDLDAELTTLIARYLEA